MYYLVANTKLNLILSEN